MKRLVLLALTGSLAGLASAQAPRIRDSAGVRIIENGSRMRAPVMFEMGTKPTIDVGGLQQNTAHEFNTRNPYPSAMRLPNGGFAVLDYSRIMLFDAAGKLIKPFGRRGQGPGEFDPATNMCVGRGDTILVGQGRRPLTKLTASGDLVATVPLPEGTYAEGQICFDDGTFAVMRSLRSGRGVPSVWGFYRAGASGLLNEIVEHEYPLFDALVYMQNPKAASGNRLYFANGNGFDITAYDRNGKLAAIIRTADALVPATAEEKAKLPLTAVRAGSSPAEVEDARRRAVASSHTKFWPTNGRMFVDPSGRIWLQDWNKSQMVELTTPTGWTAFDSTGRMLGRLIVPGAASTELRRFVVGFGKDEIIFHQLDDDGAVHYTAYPVCPLRASGDDRRRPVSLGVTPGADRRATPDVPGCS